jgi:osmotically-inducible protein OsmY
MKKLCALFILTASTSLLSANGGYEESREQSYYQGSRCPQESCARGRCGQCPQGRCGQQYGQTQSQEQGQMNQPMSGQAQGQQGGGSQEDQQLTGRIRDSLRSMFSNKYNNVNVSMNNGTVTLTGTVASDSDKSDLEQKVRSFPGVRNVNNQVTVQNQAQGSSY